MNAVAMVHACAARQDVETPVYLGQGAEQADGNPETLPPTDTGITGARDWLAPE